MEAPAITTAPTAGNENCNWMDLPRDILATILLKLDAAEILTSVQMVCTVWRSVYLESYMWRHIVMWSCYYLWKVNYDHMKMSMHAIDRSSGVCEDWFGNDEILCFIANSGCKLRRLRLLCGCGVSDEGLREAVRKLPLLEEIEFYHCVFSEKTLETIGQCCPQLKSFKLHNTGVLRPQMEYNKDAIAIANNMPGLHHLVLFGNRMTNDGLTAILDGCLYLESLDLRNCLCVDLKGNLTRRCEKIKNLRHPLECTKDYEFEETLSSSEDSEDYPTGFTDIDCFSNNDDDDYFEFSGGSDYDWNALYDDLNGNSF